MPPRPVIKVRQSRPVSAVYIGKGPSPSLQDLSHSASSYTSIIDGTPPAGIPDLPEPPSPHSSVGSVKSGLPSPPATNSTGSGSTGDPATIAVRQRPLSHHSNSSTSTSSDSYHGVTTPVRRSNSRSSVRSNSRLTDMKIEDLGAEGDFDDDYDKENDNDNESNLDGDDTARLDRKHMTNGNKADNDLHKSSSENVLALQRVKSLAQRNRMALDKLSRLGSPSPARSGTPNNSRSPAPSHSSSTSSSRVPNPPRQPRPLPQAFQDLTRSGSETERESTRHSNSNSTHSSQSSSSHMRSSSSSHHHSPSVSSSYLSTPPAPPPQRLRQTSAPTSPNKARLMVAGSTSTSASSSSNSLINSPSNRRRNRTSMASVSQLQLTDFSEEEDVDDSPGMKTATGTARDRTRERTLNERDLIIQSALAAAASSRRSPLASNRRRGALPKEFRSDQVEDSSSPNPTSGRHSVAGRYTDGDDRRESWKKVEPSTPFRPTANVGRSSTLRETRHSGGPNGRWSSDDFRSSATVRDRAQQSLLVNEEARRERRQSLRGGSAESALGMWSPGGRSLLGEGLRAAGLSRRRDEEPRGGLASASTTGSGDMFRERERRVDWSPQEVLDEGRRRVMTEREREKQPIRASTAMAHYQYHDKDDVGADDPRGRDGGRELLRNRHKSDYSLVAREQDARKEREPSITRRERDSLPAVRAESAFGRYHPTILPHSPAPLLAAHLHDRHSTSSPFGSRRYSVNQQANLSSSQSQLEPTRLLLESLAMFEAQLGKLPPSLSASNTGTGSSQAELAKNAQGVIYAAERLSSMMKHGGSRAIEAQVDCEVDATTREGGHKDVAEVWGRVASDYREGSRVADELVRGLTSLLLGMGRVVRDFSATTSEFGSPSVHGRQASLSEDERPDFGGSAVIDGSGSAESGRLSVASRRSWEPSPRDRDREREEALRRLAGAGGTRPESVLARASPVTFQKLRDKEKDTESPTNPPQSNAKNSVPLTGPSGSIRRLFTPREQREQLLDARANNRVIRGGNLATFDSQETVHAEPFQPSPTPASKSRDAPPDRQRTLTPLSIPKPLPFLPSESQARRQTPILSASANNEKVVPTRDRDRRRSTMRGTERPIFPAITTPSNATTAITPHTVSNTPSRTSFPLPRTDSDQSTRSQVTFSRPAVASVSMTLSDLHQQHERSRTTSTSSANAEPSNSVIPDSKMPNLSGSEIERDARRKTFGAKVGRASLDSQGEKERVNGAATTATRNVTVHAADRSAASTILQQSAGSIRERRRTVTDIWPRE